MSEAFFVDVSVDLKQNAYLEYSDLFFLVCSPYMYLLTPFELCLFFFPENYQKIRK